MPIWINQRLFVNKEIVVFHSTKDVPGKRRHQILLPRLGVSNQKLLPPAVAASTSSSASELSPDDSEFMKELTELDMVSSSGGLSLIGVDKLPIHYLSVNLHGYDVGIVQDNKTAPSKRI